MSTETVYEDEDSAQEACEEFQELLRLLDWKIKVRFAPAELFESCEAKIFYTEYDKKAQVYLISPDDSHSETDHEADLLHELIHLHVDPFSEEQGEKHDLKELAINCIVDSILTLRRLNEKSLTTKHGPSI